MAVASFRGERFFLSNFFPAKVLYEDVVYLTAEHAYQAAKAVNKEDRNKIATVESAGAAKRLGRMIKKRTDWEHIKTEIMYQIVYAKFSQNIDLKLKLLATKNEPLIEENSWHDTFWGVDISTGRGYNMLGKILMRVRSELVA